MNCSGKAPCPPELRELEKICEKARALAGEVAKLAKQADSLELKLIQESIDDHFPVNQVAQAVLQVNQAFKALTQREAISMARILKYRRWLRTGEATN